MNHDLSHTMQNDIEYGELLKKVCDLALKVGQYQAEQRKVFTNDRIEKKQSHDYVSYVDRESERMIVSELKHYLPQAGFITEEHTTEQSHDSTGYEWIIDPLDGTTNFIHDLGAWCVSIALKYHGELVLGVVYEVTRKELFYATKGGGAWLQTADGCIKCLKVSPVSEVDQALVLIEFPCNAEDFCNFGVSLINRLYGHCVGFRSLGSAEVELCYVAAGRLDVYIESFIHAWDVSAGAIILKEAGGTMTDYQGENQLWQNGREVLATNGQLHQYMLNVIKQCNTQTI